ncbi:PglL family O-oligosaccharyltransferase [Acinetobacter johnsonii]|uniref:PglL family O-oligosaccharyltransferase n=1 Tax=Acinetobacter johnsonii TaxID=40214 RepID=UPI00244BCE62|nr:O-antigen ligase family protein [Acinetobacter johnsonii]MDH1713773.1 Wzy polymerase domain-containing protein [Acinetobacter johnsonii]
MAAESEFLVFLALLLVFLYSIYKYKHLVVSKQNLPWVFIVIIPFIQYFFGKIYFFGDALIAFLYMISFFMALVLGNTLGQYKQERQSFFLNFSYIVVFTGLISVYIQLNQWFYLDVSVVFMAEIPLDGRPFANFGQPNTLATFLCMGLMSSLYLYEKKYINRLIGILISILILFGIALTQSRTAWVFSFAFFIFWFWKTTNFQTRLKKWSVLYFAGIYLFFIIILPYISNYLGVIGTSDVLTRATTGYLRIPMWNQMLHAIHHQPWWGYGWNQVSVAQLAVVLDYPTTEWTEHSHNIILDLLIWNGIPLGFLIIFFVAWWLYQLSKLATTIESFIALGMVGAVLVHAMLEYPLEYAFFLLPVGFLLGLVQAEDKKIKIIKIQRGFIGLFLTISIIIYTWIFVEYRMIEKDAQLVRFESLNIGTLHAEDAAPKVVLLTQLREKIRFIRTAPTKNMSEKQLDWMRSVAYRFASASALHRYAQALALNNQPELAKKHLRIIKQLHGKNYSFESLFYVNKSLAFEWNNQDMSKP